MLAIIIVSYKNNSQTIKYVRQELTKIKCPHKVVIVNNGATDESNEELCDSLSGVLININKACNKSGSVFVINNPENSGFAKGNNLGADFAKNILHADFLLFSNNDIVLKDDNVVEELIGKLASDERIGIIGPSVIGLDGKSQSPEPFVSFWDRMVWMYISVLFYSVKKRADRFKFNYSDNALEGEHYKLMGSFFVVRTIDYFKCGMMDENTFLYAEEPILTERMKRVGLIPYFYPTVTVIHAHGDTTKKHLNKSTISDIQYKSERYYYKYYIRTPAWQLLVGDLVHKLYKILK